MLSPPRTIFTRACRLSPLHAKLYNYVHVHSEDILCTVGWCVIIMQSSGVLTKKTGGLFMGRMYSAGPIPFQRWLTKSTSCSCESLLHFLVLLLAFTCLSFAASTSNFSSWSELIAVLQPCSISHVTDTLIHEFLCFENQDQFPCFCVVQSQLSHKGGRYCGLGNNIFVMGLKLGSIFYRGKQCQWLQINGWWWDII